MTVFSRRSVSVNQDLHVISKLGLLCYRLRNLILSYINWVV